MSDFGQAILDSIEKLGIRIEGRFSAIDSRLTGLEDRLSGVEDRLSAMDRRFVTMEGRQTTIDNRLTVLEQVVADLDSRIKMWPDMRYLGSAARTQMARTREIVADIAEMKTKLDEIYRTMATDPEIRHLREDVAHFRNQAIDLEVRIGAIESRLGVNKSRRSRLVDRAAAAANQSPAC